MLPALPAAPPLELPPVPLVPPPTPELPPKLEPAPENEPELPPTPDTPALPLLPPLSSSLSSDSSEPDLAHATTSAALKSQNNRRWAEVRISAEDSSRSARRRAAFGVSMLDYVSGCADLRRADATALSPFPDAVVLPSAT